MLEDYFQTTANETLQLLPHSRSIGISILRKYSCTMKYPHPRRLLSRLAQDNTGQLAFDLEGDEFLNR